MLTFGRVSQALQKMTMAQMHPVEHADGQQGALTGRVCGQFAEELHQFPGRTCTDAGGGSDEHRDTSIGT